MAKYICQCNMYEGGKNYNIGDEIELTEQRAKALAGSVSKKSGEKVAAKKKDK